MPFSSNIYVGVTHKDDDRTISNINRIQPNNYLLDISSFSLKIKDLLTYFHSYLDNVLSWLCYRSAISLERGRTSWSKEPSKTFWALRTITLLSKITHSFYRTDLMIVYILYFHYFIKLNLHLSN